MNKKKNGKGTEKRREEMQNVKVERCKKLEREGEEEERKKENVSFAKGRQRFLLRPDRLTLEQGEGGGVINFCHET